MELIENQMLGTILAFLYGLLFGSFATMASHRIPRGEELIFTPSHCPKCDQKLNIIDLFPVFSWAFNKGKCHYCKSKVHWRYPAIEMAMGGLFAAYYWKEGFTITTLSLTLMATCLVISLVILLEKQMLSSLMSQCLIPIAILYKYSIDSALIDYFLIALITFIIMQLANLMLKSQKKRQTIPNGIIYFAVSSSLFITKNELIICIIIFSFIFVMGHLVSKHRKYELLMGISTIGTLMLCTLFF